MVVRPQYDSVFMVYNLGDGDKIKLSLDDGCSLVMAGNVVRKVEKAENKLIPLIAPKSQKPMLNSLEISWEKMQPVGAREPAVGGVSKGGNGRIILQQFLMLLLVYLVVLLMPHIFRAALEAVSSDQSVTVSELLEGLAGDIVESGVRWKLAAFLCWMGGLMTPLLLLPTGDEVAAGVGAEKNVWSLYVCASESCYIVENSDEDEEETQEEEGKLADGQYSSYSEELKMCSWRAAGKGSLSVFKQLSSLES